MSSLPGMPKYPARQGVPNVRDLIAFRQHRQGAQAEQASPVPSMMPPIFQPHQMNTPMLPMQGGQHMGAPAAITAPNPLIIPPNIQAGPLPNGSLPPAIAAGLAANNASAPGHSGPENSYDTSGQNTPESKAAAAAQIQNIGKNAPQLPSMVTPPPVSAAEQAYRDELKSLNEDQKRARDALDSQNSSDQRRSAALAGQYGYGVGSGGAAALSRQAEMSNQEAIDKLLLSFGDRRREVLGNRAGYNANKEAQGDQNYQDLLRTVAQNGDFDADMLRWANANPDKLKGATSEADIKQAYYDDPANFNKKPLAGKNDVVDNQGRLVNDLKTQYYDTKTKKYGNGVKSVSGNVKSGFSVQLDDGTIVVVHQPQVNEKKPAGSAKLMKDIQEDKSLGSVNMGEVMAFAVAYYHRTGVWPTLAQVHEHLNIQN